MGDVLLGAVTLAKAGSQFSGRQVGVEIAGSGACAHFAPRSGLCAHRASRMTWWTVLWVRSASTS